MPDNQEKRATPENVTLPVSDTVPGPGTVQVRVLHLSDDEGDPTVVGIERDNWIGAGTAEDVVSSLKAPVPGKEPSLRAEPR
jgi:hypothetical protein